MVQKVAVILAALAAISPSSALAQSQCRQFRDPTIVGSLADAQIDEASGLAKSWANPEIFWTHNDSGDSARVFAIDESGRTVATFTLATEARDWEDIAVGPCGRDDTNPCVYVGDIGDNNAVYPEVRIHRFREPVIDENTPASVAVAEFDTFALTYAGGARNAETLMVDPADATIYIVDKTDFDPNNVYRVRLGEAEQFEHVATFSLGESGPRSGRVTGGAIAPGGTEVSIRTYDFVYTFCGSTIVEAFANPPTVEAGHTFVQSETLTYSRDGRSLYSTSERDRTAPNAAPPLVRITSESEPESQPRRDVGVEPPDSGGSRTDATPSPAARDDVSIRPIDKPTSGSSGCNCACATPGNPGATPLLAFVVLLAMVRRRQRPQKL